MTEWFQTTFKLHARKRGCYLVTDEVLQAIQQELKNFKVGLCHVFLLHTSAGLTLNENCEQSVRRDMERVMSKLVPEGNGLYEHDDEGLDDMPGHVKSTLSGVSLTIPVTNGKLGLGTWQGIWLMEYRNSSHSREVTVTIQGAKYK